jgi:hypothetical protein
VLRRIRNADTQVFAVAKKDDLHCSTGSMLLMHKIAAAQVF